MKGYKGFSKGLICRGKQYAENTVFEEDKAEICKSGMHFCENPLDVLDYYNLIDNNAELNEFAEVEALDECATDDNEKFTTKKLKIGLKLSFPALVKAAIDFAFEKTEANVDDYAKLASSGYCAQLASSGEHSVIAGIGINNIAKGIKGNWITLAEWGYDKGLDRYVPLCVRSEQIDGEKIKENTFYKLENGEFVEVG